MVMKPQTGGSNAVHHERFQPLSEWKEEEGANVLLVHIPGFEKDQIKVTYVHAMRIIRILGEQPVGNVKFSQFNQAFAVPKNCNVREIRGTFQGGILTITMPKETIPQVNNKEAKTTQEAPIPPPKGTSEPKPSKDQKETTPQASSTSDMQEMGLPQKMGKTVTSPKANSSFPDVQNDGRRADALSPQIKATKELNSWNGERIIQQVASPKSNLKQIDALPKAENNVDQKTVNKENSEDLKHRQPGDVKGDAKRKNRTRIKISDKEKYKIDKSAGDSKEKENHKEDSSASKAEETKSAATAAKKAVRGFALELDEERKSILNIGVAVVVIVALGTYIYYSFGSFVKLKE
ncbi:HSP20 domain-containing protein [Cephalotus follicularis]|uniref:HSP20 domain-containing protein n=1 Tax=Cephalotus follicularis TaxID=3775 RepID=A0A1Q3B6F6_CEPFO|nr:HSP20 domain-containing protein [Cephalotus follicularis]